MASVPSILVVGAVNVDATYSFAAAQAFSIDGKFSADIQAYRLGGGAGNCVQAIRAVDEAFNHRTHIELVTRIGNPPAGNMEARIAQDVVLSILREKSIMPIDVTRGENIIPINAVVEHPDGRFIAKGNQAKEHAQMDEGFEDTIEAQVRRANVVFVDPRKPKMGTVAAELANKHHKPLMIDWGDKEWPQDSDLSEKCAELLTRADIVVVPTDAVVEGMEPNVENSDELFARLRDHYGAKNILMSNGGQPVQALIDGVEHTIPVLPHEGPKFTLAAGDARNAAVLRCLARGDDMLSAFQFGTAVASVKIKYPALEWATHLHDELMDSGTLQGPRQHEEPGLKLVHSK